LHPFAPADQAAGYRRMIHELEQMMCAVTGYDAVSLQPNAGSQGEYAGLLMIRAYHASRAEAQRNVCLIPASAHGTNPASAQMAGMHVVIVGCDDDGNVDLADLEVKVQRTPASSPRSWSLSVDARCLRGSHHAHLRNRPRRGRPGVRRRRESQRDGRARGARPFRRRCSHLNLHKTFCIPRRGRRAGRGPVAVKAHLARFLLGIAPCRRTIPPRTLSARRRRAIQQRVDPPISWMYVTMMGGEGLRAATERDSAANYIAPPRAALPRLVRGQHGLVAHECILDLRPLRPRRASRRRMSRSADRLRFHAPTMSFPVAGT
jgi:glycine dehydrogenase